MRQLAIQDFHRRVIGATTSDPSTNSFKHPYRGINNWALCRTQPHLAPTRLRPPCSSRSVVAACSTVLTVHRQVYFWHASFSTSICAGMYS
jgi:hypothetical protein